MEDIEVVLKVLAIPAVIWGLVSFFFIERYKQRLSKETEKSKNYEKLISEAKTDLYRRVFSLFFDIVKKQKTNSGTNSTKLGRDIIDIKKDALIFAPSEVVRQIGLWQEKSSANPQQGFNEYIKLIHLIRKDLGHENPLTDIDILGSFMNEPEEKEKMLIYLKNA